MNYEEAYVLKDLVNTGIFAVGLGIGITVGAYIITWISDYYLSKKLKHNNDICNEETQEITKEEMAKIHDPFEIGPKFQKNHENANKLFEITDEELKALPVKKDLSDKMND